MNSDRRPSVTRVARGYSARKLSPVIETFEPRCLLDGGFGVIAGTAFLDSANDHQLGVNSAYLAGATVQLFAVGNPVAVQTAVTNANGQYVFTNLASGDYLVKELPPAGYQASGAQVLSQVEAASVQAADTIKVTVPANPIFVNYNGVQPGTFLVVNDKVNGTSTVDSAGPMQVSLGTIAGQTNINAGYLTLCLDDIRRLSFGGGEKFPVLTQPITSTTNGVTTIPADRAGRVAFLYNHYGNTSLTNVTGPALQLAVWELIYDTNPNPDFSAGNFQSLGPVNPADSATFNQVIAQAKAYFDQSAGKSETALFLDATTPSTQPNGFQSMIATGSFNFGNTARSSLSGYVYCDTNHDGMRDTGDAPIPGSTITLTGTDVTGAAVKLSKQTDATGFYQFANLVPGTYTITQTTQPPGLAEGTNTQGTPGNGTPGKDSFVNIQLAAGVNGQNNNFGELGQAVHVTQLQFLGIHHQPTRIVLTLDGPVDPVQACNPANYTLIALGKNQHLGSSTNHRVPVSSVIYDQANGTLTVNPALHLNIHYHYLLSLDVAAANPCSPNLQYVNVFGRAAVPYFDVHGTIVPAPPLTPVQAAHDALIVSRALYRWSTGTYHPLAYGPFWNQLARQNGYVVLPSNTAGPM